LAIGITKDQGMLLNKDFSLEMEGICSQQSRLLFLF
jgi:hypothetical protein